MTKSKYHLLVVLCLLSLQVIAQPYGNEWINYSQTYFKIPIAEDGIYRISRAELTNAGLPVGSIDPRKIQVFHLGEEIAIHVEGQADGVFNTNDFVAFYGQKNDGTTDTPLYISPDAQPHPHYNLFSDSSAYFLTYRLDLNFGKRMTTFKENNVGGLAAENYAMATSLLVNHNVYSMGRNYGTDYNAQIGSYDYYEGWTGSFVSRNSTLTYTLSGLNNALNNQTPHIEILLTGGNNNSHSVEVSVGPTSTNQRIIETASFDGMENYLVDQDIQFSDISASGEMFVLVTPRGVSGQQDRIATSYIKLSYAQSFDMNDKSSATFELLSNTNDKSYIEVENSPDNLVVYDITTTEDPISIGINEFVSEFNAIVDQTSAARSLYVQSGYKTIPEITPAQFASFDPAGFDYLIITHPDLRANTSDNSGDQIEAYKNYRESVDGGSHQVLDLDIDFVFDQFNYGNPSPLAIRRLCEYMYDNGNLEFLFLIGKSANISANYYRLDPATTEVQHLVPTFGQPGGDTPYSSGLDGGSGYEVIATGRINATIPDHVQAYLNKVIEKESTPYNSLRRKNLVHLSGGNSEQELNTFKNYINQFATTAAQPVLGGETSQISKNSNTAVELINISDEINDGVMMVTFFGHASGSVTDIEIGLVSDPSYGYSNQGKYPTFMVNGCLAGNFFSDNDSLTFGVDWILTANSGATAFMAHSDQAYSSNLRRYTNHFYELAFNETEFTHLGVGQIKAETARRYVNQVGATGVHLAQVELTNLQGDPAVIVFGADKANYSVDDNLMSISTFNNEQLIANIDSFKIDFDIKNFGIYDETPLSIQVIRTFADGTTSTYGPLVYDPVLRQDTLSMTIQNQVSNAAGQNTFKVVIDPFDEIEESDKTDNSASIDLFLSNGSTLNLLPQDFSIQSSTALRFFFQSSDLMSAARDYDFQIDTLSTFNSPYLSSQTINSKVISSVIFDLSSRGAIDDQTVFYWRTRYSDPEPGENSDWVTSSFTYDGSASEGWAQRSLDQLDQSSRIGLTLDTDNSVWDFVTTSLDLSVQTFGPNHPSQTFEDTQVLLEGRNYFVSNSTSDRADCRNNTINFLAFQRQSSAPFSPITFNTAPELNALICGVLPQYIFNFTEGNFSGSVTPVQYLDAMSNGDKVLIFSQGNFDYTIWSEEFKVALEGFGIDRGTIDNLVSGQPFIFFGAKNTGETAIEVLPVTSPADQATLFLNEDVMGSFDTGKIVSTKIGPARSWASATITTNPSANPSDDETVVSVIGISASGEETTLNSTSDTNIDLSSISSSLYPFIRLELNLTDDVQFSPEQLQDWTVLYETEAEGVLLSPQAHDQAYELEEGEEQQVSYTFWNISSKDFLDSLEVDYQWLNTTMSSTFEDSTKIVGLAAGDSVQFDIDLKTLNNVGTSNLVLKVNPAQQPELYYNNNNLRITDYLEVAADEYNPVLDVLFDGIKIMDGEIVSPSPLIKITMSDENPYLLKEDTLGMNFYLKAPCEDCAYERVAFSSAEVSWQAATDEQSFEINYTPESLQDGIYSLRAQVSDASGNSSGVSPYEISFEVINESTITNFYPYPNPFSSSTRFVFTLTGSEHPEDLKIQIMTITGRVVREIFMDELGTIKIGNNISDFAWDGRDNYGDQLANGVYLYRVMIKNPGGNFEHRKTAGDKGFKNGFGKLYLLR